MPTYQYQCIKCKHEQDEFHGMSAKPEVKCEKCGSICERQQVANCNFILKGSGWASQEARVKKSMLEKNAKMTGKMSEREISGQGVKKLADVNSSKASL